MDPSTSCLRYAAAATLLLQCDALLCSEPRPVRIQSCPSRFINSQFRNALYHALEPFQLSSAASIKKKVRNESIRRRYYNDTSAVWLGYPGK
ncbi:hypothetical protein C8R46DRAFT_1081819, partial [Mycena filopes]